MDTEELRSRYRPARVTTLLLGESPPAGGTFFYACDSNLFRHTKRAFETAMAVQWQNDHAFLAAFAHFGFYLDDLCLRPVNHCTSRERRAECQRGVAPLSARLATYRPQRVIATPMSIAPYARQAMQQCGCDAPMHSLPFPVMHHRPAYESALAEIVRQNYRG